ncbi:MAG: DUF362 domain-containing protein [Spirochaetaceae bacterium]|nr:DUF362 domain-containing protein [Spirochaetaceae bacterium]
MKHRTRTCCFLGIALMCAALSVFSGCNSQKPNTQIQAQGDGVQPFPAQAPQTGNSAPVYFTDDISPAGLSAVYEALGRKVSGKVAVKLSTGEPGGHHFLSPDLIKGLVQSVDGTIVEGNTAYGGRRASTALHKQVAIDHGFTAIAPVDILDEEGSVSLPFARGKNITEDFVGSHLANYDSCLVLSHFKGHSMGGFGGALKNISIGIASSEGKLWIHTAGASKTGWSGGTQNGFLESMAEAAGAVMSYLGEENMVYISVMNHLSVDCDCSSNPAPPELDDIGILGSLDPVALDKACVDLIYASDTQRSASLRQRIESRNGTHILDHAQALGLGGQAYELVRLN